MYVCGVQIDRERCVLPVPLVKGWKYTRLDLADLTEKAFGTRYATHPMQTTGLCTPEYRRGHTMEYFVDKETNGVFSSFATDLFLPSKLGCTEVSVSIASFSRWVQCDADRL
jgi:hypothetical protein